MRADHGTALIAVRAGLSTKRVRYLLNLTEEELRQRSQQEGELMIQQLSRVRAAISEVSDALKAHTKGDSSGI